MSAGNDRLWSRAAVTGPSALGYRDLVSEWQKWVGFSGNKRRVLERTCHSCATGLAAASLANPDTLRTFHWVELRPQLGRQQKGSFGWTSLRDAVRCDSSVGDVTDATVGAASQTK